MFSSHSFAREAVWLRLLALGFFALGYTGGCKAPRRAVFHVQGKVLNWDNKPVSGASVTFIPLDVSVAEKLRPQGVTDDEGAFTLTTYESNDGAPEGQYVVTIELRPAREDSFDSALPPDTFLGKYSDPKSSKYHFRIESRSNNILPTIILE